MSEATLSRRGRVPKDTGEGGGERAVEGAGWGAVLEEKGGMSFGEERERWQGETRPSKPNLHVSDGKMDIQAS